MTTYRLDRAHALVVIGVLFVVAAALVVVAFLASPWVWAAVALVALAALWLWVRPPVVARLDEKGFRGRVRTAGGAFRGEWAAVENAEVGANVLSLRREDGTELQLPLALVQSGRRADLVREVYERLNAANGYQRFAVE